MPEQKGKPQEEPKGKPQEEDFVSKVVKDPAQPPDVLLLTGYLGASSEPGYTRLYFDAQLSNYVEIPDAAILHIQKIPAEQSPLGESYVWIDKNAEIIHGKVGPNRPKAKFLEGPIFQDFMRGAQFGGAAAPQPAPQPTLLGSPTCAPELCLLPSVAHPCPTPSAVQLCQSQPAICQPSVAVPCHSPFLVACPPLTFPYPCPPPSVHPVLCPPSVHMGLCPLTAGCPVATFFSPACPTIAGCPPPWTPGSIACGWGQQPGGPGQAGGGAAMAQPVQPFAGAAPQPG